MKLSAVSRVWAYLTTPGDAAQDHVSIYHARLFLSFLLALLPLGILIVVIPNLRASDSFAGDEDVVAILGGILVWIPTYFVGRRGYYRWATRMALAAALGVILYAAHPDPLEDYVYLLILILFSSILLPFRETLMLTGLCLGSVLLIPLVANNASFAEILFGPWSFLLIGIALILLGARHHTRLEESRRDELATRLRQIQEIYRMSVAVSRADSLQSIFATALDSLLRSLSADRGAVLLFDEQGIMRFEAWRGLSHQYRQAVDGHSPWSVDAVNPQPLLIPDVTKDTQFLSLHGVLKEEGIYGLAFIPLIHQRRLLGKFMLYCNQPHEFNLTEVQLAQTIASHIAFALARRRSDDALRASQERYERATEAAKVGVWDWDLQDNTIHVDPNLRVLLDKKTKPSGDTIEEWLQIIHGDDVHHLKENMAAHFADETAEFHAVFRILQKGNKVLWIAARGRAMRNEHDEIVRVVGTGTDVSERKEAELALQASQELMYRQQKMESMGMLAGGVAHDFNNLLVGILGQASLAQAKMDPEAPGYEHVAKAVRAAERAAELTNQLLAYSGRGHFTKRALHLNEVVEDNLHLFRVAVPRHVALAANLADNLPLIEADPGQMQQVIMNLLLNAAEAIQESGEVTMSTALAILTESDPQRRQQNGEVLPPGRYVSLTVVDDGCGMDQETMSRIFDPFFSTKFTGRGLGLAAVLGIVQGHRGGIQVSSQPGAGTTFRLLLPALEASKVTNR